MNLNPSFCGPTVALSLCNRNNVLLLRDAEDQMRKRCKVSEVPACL